MGAKGRKPQNISQYNNKIISELLLEKPYSCIEMSKKVKLTHTATGLIVDRLLCMDLIRNRLENIVKRPKGRQHVRYEINPDRAFFVCLNFQNSLESFSICNLVGKVLYSEKLTRQIVDEVLLNELIEKIKNKIQILQLSIDKLAVVSIAIPGRINTDNGAVIVSSKISEEVNLRDSFKKSFPNATIDIKNDIVYTCTGSMLSHEFDYGKGTHLFAYIGDGLSCCLVYNGQIISGASGFDGEIGMNTVDRSGLHLYDVASYDKLLIFAKKTLNKSDVSFDEIMQSCETNSDIKGKMLDMANILGVALRNIVDIAGCSHIVFSGVITQFPKFFFDELYSVVTNTIYKNRVVYNIEFSKIDTAEKGQIYLSRTIALDWVMAQYLN